jgi:hypothetical protein
VIGGAVFWAPASFVNDASWTSSITNRRTVRFRDIVDFVLGQPLAPFNAEEIALEQHLKP